MPSTPDAHPDMTPKGPSESPERVTPPAADGHEAAEDSPGTDGGTGGTGGTNHRVDRDVTS